MTQQTDEQTVDLKGIFDLLPDAFPGVEPNVKAINFSILQSIVNTMTAKARLEGQLQATNDLSTIVSKAFNHV